MLVRVAPRWEKYKLAQVFEGFFRIPINIYFSDGRGEAVPRRHQRGECCDLSSGKYQEVWAKTGARGCPCC